MTTPRRLIVGITDLVNDAAARLRDPLDIHLDVRHRWTGRRPASAR